MVMHIPQLFFHYMLRVGFSTNMKMFKEIADILYHLLLKEVNWPLVYISRKIKYKDIQSLSKHVSS